ncbi:hypothetical protein Pla52o_11110 [Novipirellula galeiformis]|uniref:Uncharacterized protein n=1 Tax=Novipirellula galeiformis TaxID=2528004 RepID=A0A5C6CN78_9BACT|nr:hypothetical protein [Novipirellula galeiformis]TWU24821.1 hypothetical protein Pla52o_11110 [Novipirellula galeiformis]
MNLGHDYGGLVGENPTKPFFNRFITNLIGVTQQKSIRADSRDSWAIISDAFPDELLGDSEYSAWGQSILRRVLGDRAFCCGRATDAGHRMRRLENGRLKNIKT